MLAQRIGFILTLTLVTLAFVAILLPFYSAILWAVILAIVFFPMHAKIELRLGNYRNVAASISVLTCLGLVIVPGLAVLASLIQQGGQLYGRIKSGDIDISGFMQKLQDALPVYLKERIPTLDVEELDHLGEGVSPALLEGGGFFAGRALYLGQSTLEFILAFGTMLYLLFFLFRDGRALARTVRRSIPLSDSHTRQFASRFTSVVRATIRGNIIIAMIQGLIGGVTFWSLELRPALLWGVAMGIFSLLPAVGAAIVWIPAVIYLVLAGMWGNALILTLVGVFVIGLVDNLLRPLLVGQETKLPDYVVLISTVGGIALIGINGFVIGPLVAALFVAAWSIFVTEPRFPGGAARDEPDVVPRSSARSEANEC